MDVVDWLLINGAEALRWLGGVIAAFFSLLWAGLTTVLNPVLSPVLSFLNPVCTTIGDAVYTVLGVFPVWLGLTVISGVAGVMMLFAFRYLSNQTALGKAKDDIKANLLALKLYKDDLRVTFSSQWRLLGAIARLQRYMLTPILILLLPMLLALAQMGIRYQWRPLHVGEEAVIRLKLAPAFTTNAEVVLLPGPGLTVEAGPVPGGGEVVWRVRAGEPGRHTLHFQVNDAVVDKELVVGDRFQRVSALRPARRWTSQILHPVEPPLRSGLPTEAIEIRYPERESWIHGTNYWVLYFFVVSMIAALVLRPLFNVRF